LKVIIDDKVKIGLYIFGAEWIVLDDPNIPCAVATEIGAATGCIACLALASDALAARITADAAPLHA
jgi:hypothetical protein